jgi:hypothetical protein
MRSVLRKSPGASHDDDIAAEIAKLEQDMAAGQEAGIARSQTQSAEDLPSLANALEGHDEDDEVMRGSPGWVGNLVGHSVGIRRNGRGTSLTVLN